MDDEARTVMDDQNKKDDAETRTVIDTENNNDDAETSRMTECGSGCVKKACYSIYYFYTAPIVKFFCHSVMTCMLYCLFYFYIIVLLLVSH